MKCRVCGKDDSSRPMCFLGLPYCCELHRKQLAASGQLLKDGMVAAVKAIKAFRPVITAAK